MSAPSSAEALTQRCDGSRGSKLRHHVSRKSWGSTIVTGLALSINDYCLTFMKDMLAFSIPQSLLSVQRRSACVRPVSNLPDIGLFRETPRKHGRALPAVASSCLLALRNCRCPRSTGMRPKLLRIPFSLSLPPRAPSLRSRASTRNHQASAARLISPTPVPTMTAPRRHANTTIALAAQLCMPQPGYCRPRQRG